MVKKRAMSSKQASVVKLRGHAKEKEFANLIGLGNAYQNDKKAKKDVIDHNGGGHSVKSGTWWQIFLYSAGRIRNDYGFLAMNGMGQLILDCLNIFPQNFEDYQKDKQKYKNLLQTPMTKLCEKLQDKNRLKAFLSKSIFNGGEVQFLTIFSKDSNIHVFYYKDVIDILAQNFSVENSRALNLNQTNAQKVLFKSPINIGEIETRNDSKVHYKEIKFRLNAKKTLEILTNNITNKDIPKTINGVFNERIYRYEQAIKKFKA